MCKSEIRGGFSTGSHISLRHAGYACEARCRCERTAARSLVFPRPPPRAVTDVMNDDLIRSDFVHDQIIADRKSPKSWIVRCLAQVWLLGNPRRSLFDASDEARCGVPIVFRNVSKNRIKIGERTAFVPELHALR